MRKQILAVALWAAMILLGYNALAAELYPQETVGNTKADVAVWVVCIHQGFEYDDGSGNMVKLDPSLLTFDEEGDPNWTDVVSANWPAGQDTAMRAFYEDRFYNWLVKVAGQAALMAQNANLKTPDELSGGF